MGIPQKEIDNITSFGAYSIGNESDSSGISLYVRQKHRDALLKVLYVRKSILHVALAKELKISASGLNAVIKKINDVKDPPIKPIKVGKYKYYSLTVSGRRFVEEVLMPPEQRLSMEHMREVWDIFRNKAGTAGEEHFNSLFYLAGKSAEEIDGEIESVFCEFINCFLSFYKKDIETATAFVKELITSASVRENILTYAESKLGTSQNLIILNSILSLDDEKAYSLLDDLYELSIKKNEQLKPENYDVTDTDAFVNAIQTIKCTVLHAIVAGEKKDILREMWIKEGMERQLAYYAAEKYRMLLVEIGSRYSG